jgi:hypothetical protein
MPTTAAGGTQGTRDLGKLKITSIAHAGATVVKMKDFATLASSIGEILR